MASTLISISPKLFSRSIAAYRDRTARITEYRCLARTADSAHIVSGIVLYRACIARISFESIRKGIRPKAPFHNFESIANIADSLYILEVATVPGACIPCDANPLNLFCLCKICRKIGICKHILLTTHFVMASGPKEERKAICNLKYMTTSISGAKKGKGTQGGRAKAIALALEREEANDDDDNSLLQITW